MLPNMRTAPSSGGNASFFPYRSSENEHSLFPSWITERVARFLIYIFSIIMSIVSVLAIRIVLECIIVVFRIAEDIGYLKNKFVENESSA
jgi:hypothetical protein